MNNRQRRQWHEKKLKIHRVKTARELIDLLRPINNKLWQTKLNEDSSVGEDKEWYRSWIFRGQADSRWYLDPSAWRKPKLKPYMIGQNAPFIKEIKRSLAYYKNKHDKQSPIYWDRVLQITTQALIEISLALEFRKLADDLGFRLPGSNLKGNLTYIEPIIEGLIGIRQDKIYHHLWNDPLFALAQHYDIPTRLLDWTRNPLVAAYFAARDAAKSPRKNGLLAIYAIHTLNLNQPSIGIYECQTSRSDNAFLLAQDGVLVFSQRADDHCFQTGEYPDLIQSLYGQFYSACPAQEFMPHKFTLPHKEVSELLRLLFLERITAAHVMPTLTNVAETIKAKWQFVLTTPDDKK